MDKSALTRLPSRWGNHALDRPLTIDERVGMTEAAATKIAELLEILNVDYKRDHNTRDTPHRVARAYVEEFLNGRFAPPPRVTEFDNVDNYDQMIVTGPIEVRSLCAHHLMPIYGSAFIGILPQKNGKIIGLSKYDRIVDHFARRLQIQEELVKQIADFIVEETEPRGLIVRVSAVHMCKTHRGVRARNMSRMVNSFAYGKLKTDPELRAEFFRECASIEQVS